MKKYVSEFVKKQREFKLRVKVKLLWDSKPNGMKMKARTYIKKLHGELK